MQTTTTSRSAAALRWLIAAVVGSGCVPVEDDPPQGEPPGVFASISDTELLVTTTSCGLPELGGLCTVPFSDVPECRLGCARGASLSVDGDERGSRFGDEGGLSDPMILPADGWRDADDVTLHISGCGADEEEQVALVPRPAPTWEQRRVVLTDDGPALEVDTDAERVELCADSDVSIKCCAVPGGSPVLLPIAAFDHDETFTPFRINATSELVRTTTSAGPLVVWQEHVSVFAPDLSTDVIDADATTVRTRHLVSAFVLDPQGEVMFEGVFTDVVEVERDPLVDTPVSLRWLRDGAPIVEAIRVGDLTHVRVDAVDPPVELDSGNRIGGSMVAEALDNVVSFNSGVIEGAPLSVVLEVRVLYVTRQ